MALRPHLNETRLVQNPKVPGDARLVDLNVADDVIHRQLSLAKDFDDPETRRVGECLERANMHKPVYTHTRIDLSRWGHKAEPCACTCLTLLTAVSVSQHRRRIVELADGQFWFVTHNPIPDSYTLVLGGQSFPTRLTVMRFPIAD